MNPNEIADAIGPHLPYLRRFARALTGSQSVGDGYVAATLEAILADTSIFAASIDPRVALFRVFHAIWSSSGARIDAPEGEAGVAAQKAQERLRALAPGTREAVLLKGLEGFDRASVARIMDIDEEEAARLTAAGWRDLAGQVAGRVLIIEDELMIAMELESIVTGLGHRIAGVCATRKKAVDAALAEKPNLVLADIQLADGSSGIDAVNDIQTAFDVPVIFITAYPERLLTGKRAEPTFLITKPFRQDEVRAAVGQALFFGTAIQHA